MEGLRGMKNNTLLSLVVHSSSACGAWRLRRALLRFFDTGGVGIVVSGGGWDTDLFPALHRMTLIVVVMMKTKWWNIADGE
jgi:hypothetical protein